MTLALDNVCKTVGSETHIDGVSLELVEGSFNVLLGRTLAGKTTLMRLRAGLERPTEAAYIYIFFKFLLIISQGKIPVRSYL